MRVEPQSIAVVGAGVAGCALVAQLRRLGCRAAITLLEAGRAAGGRAATRRSRHDLGLAINHGAPLFNISCRQPPALLDLLLQDGWIETWPPGPAGLAWLEVDGQLQQGNLQLDSLHQGSLYQGSLYQGKSGMESLAGGLLELAVAATPAGLAPPLVSYGVLVRQLVPNPQGAWSLLDDRGQLLAQADWLVLAGTLLAHPRATQLFGWSELPLAGAAQQLGDRRLWSALAAIAELESEARCNLLTVIAADAAQPWLELPFRLLSFTVAAQGRWGLERLSIQPLADGRVVVVAHSTAALAARYLGVAGSSSSAGRRQATPADPKAENRLIEALGQGVKASLAGLLSPTSPGLGLEQGQLMRWGAAFPSAPGLDAETMVCPTSRVALCGDAIAGPGQGRVEGALRSAEWLAARLLNH